MACLLSTIARENIGKGMEKKSRKSTSLSLINLEDGNRGDDPIMILTMFGVTEDDGLLVVW